MKKEIKYFKLLKIIIKKSISDQFHYHNQMKKKMVFFFSSFTYRFHKSILKCAVIFY